LYQLQNEPGIYKSIKLILEAVGIFPISRFELAEQTLYPKEYCAAQDITSDNLGIKGQTALNFCDENLARQSRKLLSVSR
jgi:hypothetical protein